MKNLNLQDYILVKPDSVEIVESKEEITLIDICLEKDNTFFIHNSNTGEKILTHNCDGHHISSLLIYLFAKWFPDLFEKGMIYKLITPLVSTETDKGRKYFNSINDFEIWSKYNKTSKVRYLKGLGSLDVDQDWEYVMKTERNLQQYKYDRSATKMLEMAFGDNAQLRKTWLST